jgi:hypothetical protein
MSSVYHINKGINKSIEFRGLRAQYIGYLAAGLVVLLILFVILYVAGINRYACLVLVFGSGTALVVGVFRLSHKYGRYGLMKKSAKRRIPDYLRFSSRKIFINLNKKSHPKTNSNSAFLLHLGKVAEGRMRPGKGVKEGPGS